MADYPARVATLSNGKTTRCHSGGESKGTTEGTSRGTSKGTAPRAGSAPTRVKNLAARPVSEGLGPGPSPILFAMRPARATWLLLAIMLWQALSCLSPFNIDAQIEQVTHLTVHLTVHQQRTEHHHHDDASLHLAPDSDGTVHTHVDPGVQSGGLWPAPPEVVLDVFSGAVPAVPVTEPQTVFLDGLLRPPRSQV